MKKWIGLILAMICSQWVFSQAIVRGKVAISEQRYLASATVCLESDQRKYQAKTDTLGDFQFLEVLEGNYRLKVSALGFETFLKKVSFKTSDDFDFGIVYLTVKEDDMLQTVEVVGNKSKKYYSDYSFSATKIATLNKDIPQAISTISKDLLQDRQAFTLSDAMKNVSSVAPTSFYNHFAIRGITQNEEGAIINGMRTRQIYFIQPLTNHLERIEVIKGPASATFSSVDPGGTINMVTKKPLNVARKSVSVSVGSFSTMRASLDFTGPMNDDKTLLYRLNVGYEDAKGFRDLQFRKSFLIAPSFSYVPATHTALNVEMVLNQNNSRLDRGQPIFGAIPGVSSLTTTPISFAMGNTDDFYKTSDAMLMANFYHQVAKGLRLNVSYMKQTWAEDLFENRTSNAFAVDVDGNSIPTLALMRIVKRKQYWNNDNLSAYLNYDFNKSGFESHMVVGYDFIGTHKMKGGSSNTAAGYLRKDGTTSAYNGDTTLFQLRNYTVTYGGKTQTLRAPVPNVPHFDLTNPTYTLNNETDYRYKSVEIPPAYYRIHAVYIQEQLKWNKFLLTMGLRNEWYEDIAAYKKAEAFRQSYIKLLPRMGLTYTVNKHINVYATYLQGYQPQSNASLSLMTPPPNTRFKPFESDLKEIGLKTEWWNQRLILNLAAFDINQRNIAISANDPNNVDLFVQRGAERSRGIELDLAGSINDYWRLNLGYSYIHARVLDDVNTEVIGQRTANAPVHSANFWTRYDLPSSSVFKGFGIGVGVQMSGDRVPFYTRSFVLPGYTVMDMALYYTPELTKIQLQLNVNNLWNQTYWLGAFDYNRLFPGAPRNMMLNLLYKF